MGQSTALTTLEKLHRSSTALTALETLLTSPVLLFFPGNGSVVKTACLETRSTKVAGLLVVRGSQSRFQTRGEVCNSNKGRAANNLKQEPANRCNRCFRCMVDCFPFEFTSRAAGQGLPSPHRLFCLFSCSLPSQFRISKIKVLISNLDMTLHAPHWPQGKVASVGGSASIGPTPKTGGKEVPPLQFASPSESIRATSASRGWHRAPSAACARAATRAAHTDSLARAHRQPARRPRSSRRTAAAFRATHAIQRERRARPSTIIAGQKRWTSDSQNWSSIEKSGMSSC